MIQEAILELCIVGGLGLTLILAGVLASVMTKARNNKCKCTSVGKVVDYYYKGEMRVGPVVEFEAQDGITYRTRKTYEGYKSVVRVPAGASDIWEGKDGYLHTRRGMTGRWRECAEELWPIGSELTVFYNPNNPAINYVDKPVSNKFFVKVFALSGIGITVLSVVMFFLMR